MSTSDCVWSTRLIEKVALIWSGGEDARQFRVDHLDRAGIRLVIVREREVADVRGDGRIVQGRRHRIDLLLRGHLSRARVRFVDRRAHVDGDLGAVGPERLHLADLHLHQHRRADESQ
jgi:hypothetical protein